jgi:RNA-directed DNA polymerase
MNIKPSKQKWLPLEYQGDVFVSGYEVERPVEDERLMERMLERENVMSALRRVEANRGSAGVDGMPVSQLRNYLKEHWPCIREQLLTGQYIASPVRRVELPKPGGGIRKLGIPTVLDRFIQQILLQVLQEDWDPSFSEASFGFRPGRSAHQAIARAQEYVKAGFTWVVDMDLEKFFDRVDHDVLMSEVRKRISDRRILTLIRRYLRAGVFIDEIFHDTVEGTPQGGPLSPLLANLLLDRLDRELEKRGHRFVRYADDSNIYVKSRCAANRVMHSTTRFYRAV